MKKIKYIVLGLTVMSVFSSCEEDFNPYAEFREGYVFNCILRCDTTFQYATLDANYVVDDLNPYNNHVDPAVHGAFIRMWSGDSVVIFQEGEIPRIDTSRYNTPFHYYYSDNFLPAERTEIYFEIVLPNGKKLSSQTLTPKSVSLIGSASDKYIPPTEKDFIQLRWEWEISNSVYVPRLYIPYLKEEPGGKKRYIKEVPVEYQKTGDVDKPIYPSFSNNVAIIYEMDAIEKALTEISAGDPNKSNYTILAGIFEVISVDMNLSTYYSASNIAENNFTIKLDETDYSNVDGGYGIFGSYTKQKYSLIISRDFIESFGYKSLIYD